MSVLEALATHEGVRALAVVLEVELRVGPDAHELRRQRAHGDRVEVDHEPRAAAVGGGDGPEPAAHRVHEPLPLGVVERGHLAEAEHAPRARPDHARERRAADGSTASTSITFPR